jgi:hypothetical protein
VKYFLFLTYQIIHKASNVWLSWLRTPPKLFMIMINAIITFFKPWNQENLSLLPCVILSHFKYRKFWSLFHFYQHYFHLKFKFRAALRRRWNWVFLKR